MLASAVLASAAWRAPGALLTLLSFGVLIIQALVPIQYAGGPEVRHMQFRGNP